MLHSSAPLVAPDTNTHTDAVGPNRRTAAAAATPIASNASATGDPRDSIGPNDVSNRCANSQKCQRISSARQAKRRNQPRTVSAGTPTIAAIRRAPEPAAHANTAADTREQASTVPQAAIEPVRRPTVHPSPHSDSFARAFDNLRAIAAGSRLRSLVIAAASVTEKVEPVVAGLAAEACQHQLETLTAAFTESEGEYLLRKLCLYGAEQTSVDTDLREENPSISFHLGTADLPGVLTAWIENAGESHDLLLLHGPALGNSVDAALIARLEQMKTGALIAFSCEAGAIAAAADDEARHRLRAFGVDLGLAFQVRDDLLDVEGDEAALGKKVGKDADAGKATLVAMLGADGARREAERLIERASARLDGFGPRAAALREVAGFVLSRRW